MGYAYVIWHYLHHYAIPCTFLLFFYSLIILHKRQNHYNLASSSTIESATNELTKTAIVVTLVFVVTIGFDPWTYLLVSFGYIPSYTLGSPI